MTRHAVGVMNGNFRAGDYYRYAQEVSNAAKPVCPICEKEITALPNYLVGKTDLCFGCYEASKNAAPVPHPIDAASLLDVDASAEAREIAGEVERMVDDTFPFSHADFMDEKRTQEEARC